MHRDMRGRLVRVHGQIGVCGRNRTMGRILCPPIEMATSARSALIMAGVVLPSDGFAWIYTTTRPTRRDTARKTTILG
jgi:hypothetical protein